MSRRKVGIAAAAAAAAAVLCHAKALALSFVRGGGGVAAHEDLHAGGFAGAQRGPARQQRLELGLVRRQRQGP